MRNIPIIQSQLAPPPLRERLIQRSKLNKKLMRIPNYPLTLMYAGAGYGKSTALAFFAHEKDACWYAISNHDDDILPFLMKLVQAIKQKHPSFGHDILTEMQNVDNYMTTEEIHLLASTFINEIIDLEVSVFLIIDDFHHVNTSNEIQTWLFLLLEHFPINLHLILSSRNKPRINLLSKWKVRGELLEITEQDLIFSADEMHFVLEDIYQLEVNEGQMKQIYSLTEGWAIAFNMLAQHLYEGTTIEILFQNRQTSLHELFDYLAMEVLAKQSLIIQQFLLQSSVIEVLDPQACDEILQITGSGEILTGLVEQSLFIVEEKGNNYRYHALFKAFLENRLLTNYHAEYDTIHRRAATFFKKKQKLDAVLYHYRKIQAYQALAKMLSQYGDELLKVGRLQILYDLLSEVPDEYKQLNPVLYFYQGEIERYRSLYEKAEKSYDRIISYVPEYDQAHYQLIGLAFESKARIYLDTIQPDKAERFLNQAIIMREKAKDNKGGMAKLYQLMAENLLNFGQATKAEAWFERAKQLDLPMVESNLQARIYLRTGRIAMAKEVLQARKVGSPPEQSLKHLPQAHRETDILLSFIQAIMGEVEDSKQLASDGIQLGLSIQSPFVEACGWMRMGHAVQLLERYDRALAVQCYETSLALMEKINISRGKAEPYMGLAILYGKQLNYEQAIAHARKGLKETEKAGDRWLGALIKVGMGLAEISQRQLTKAAEIFANVKSDMLACGDRYGLTITAFWSAYIADKQKDEVKFQQEMAFFLHEVQVGAYDFFLKKRTLFGPTDLQNMTPMLLKARQLEIAPQYVTRLIGELGLNAQLKNHPGYTLRMDTLGEFNVWLGQRLVRDQDWQREKAKELLALFITQHQQLLEKEEIFEYLWPNESDEAANQKFKVTLNALLKVLEPNRKAREESFFIIRNGSSYGLNPKSSYELDRMNFEKWVTAGLEEKNPKRAKEILEKGLQLYHGDYLAELRFASWSIPERDHLGLLFLRGAEKIAQLAVRLHEFNQCIDWCERILAIDHTWEEAYRLMMYSYYKHNNRPQAIRWYEKCREVLAGELGVNPTEATEDMYHLVVPVTSRNLSNRKHLDR